jgi:hypothetical protein
MDKRKAALWALRNPRGLSVFIFDEEEQVFRDRDGGPQPPPR